MLQLDAVDRNYVCAWSDLKVQNSTKAPGDVAIDQKNQRMACGYCLRQRIQKAMGDGFEAGVQRVALPRKCKRNRTVAVEAISFVEGRLHGGGNVGSVDHSGSVEAK